MNEFMDRRKVASTWSGEKEQLCFLEIMESWARSLCLIKSGCVFVSIFQGIFPDHDVMVVMNQKIVFLLVACCFLLGAELASVILCLTSSISAQ